MSRLLAIAALLSAGSPLAAQQAMGVEASGTRPEGAVAIASRTIEIPDRIAFAVVPYAQCLSSQRDRMQGEGISLFDEPNRAAEILQICANERDEAIFMASTALERAAEPEIAARRMMIFDTIETMEGMVLQTELPQSGSQ